MAAKSKMKKKAKKQTKTLSKTKIMKKTCHANTTFTNIHKNKKKKKQFPDYKLQQFEKKFDKNNDVNLCCCHWRN